MFPSHPSRLYLIRHGEVEERYHKVFGGSRIDMGLSPLGLRQAAAVAEWFKETKIDAIYASPMLRVRQTMAPLVAAKQLEPIIMDDLREVDFGDWTGHTWDGIKEHFNVSAYDWLSELDGPGIPNGEHASGLLSRVRPCLSRVLHESPQSTSAIFCHGGIVRVLLAALIDLPLTKMAHFGVDYASITMVEVQPHKKHAVEIDLLNYQPLAA